MTAQSGHPTELEILRARAQVALDQKLGRTTSPTTVEASQQRLPSEAGVVAGQDGTVLVLMPNETSEPRAKDLPSRLGGRALAHIPGQEMRGDDVLELQQRLANLGYDLGERDAVFGSRTEAAVRAFQAEYEVTNDGVVGDVTVRVLQYLRNEGIDADHPATVQQMHHIGHVVRVQSTGLVLVDLFSGLSRLNDPKNRQLAERVLKQLGEQVEAQIEAETNMQCWVIGAEWQADDAAFADFANEIRAPHIVSLSLNDSSREAVGVATYFFGEDGKYESHIGKPLAQAVHRSALAATGLPDRGVHPEKSELFTRAKLPTIRVEYGNLRLIRDRDRLANARVLDRLAAGIASGIRNYYLLVDHSDTEQALNVGGGASPAAGGAHLLSRRAGEPSPPEES